MPPFWEEMLGLGPAEAAAEGTLGPSASGGGAAAGALRVLRPRGPAGTREGGEWEEQPGVPPWPSPLEERQRVEWHLRGLSFDPRSLQMRYCGLPVRQGAHLTSPTFAVAGVRGRLRFWPRRTWRSSQSSRLRREIQISDPSTASWSALGLLLPPGTHLQLRFFVGDSSSDLQECYWGSGPSATQLWVPHQDEPPERLEGLVVGVEVRKNLRHLRPREASAAPAPRAPRRGAAAGASPRTLAEAALADARRGAARRDLGACLALASGGLGRPLPPPRFARGVLTPRS